MYLCILFRTLRLSWFSTFQCNQLLQLIYSLLNFLYILGHSLRLNFLLLVNVPLLLVLITPQTRLPNLQKLLLFIQSLSLSINQTYFQKHTFWGISLSNTVKFCIFDAKLSQLIIIKYLFLMRITRSALVVQNIVQGNIDHLPNDSQAKSSSTDEELNQGGYVYREDELVWAKILGFPWWPAVINKKVNKLTKTQTKGRVQKYEIQYEVQFLGDETIAYLTKEKLAQYTINREFFIEAAKKAKKTYNIHHFELAVKEANEITDNLNEGWSNESESVVEEDFVIKKRAKKEKKQTIEEGSVNTKKVRSRKRKQGETKKINIEERCLSKEMAVTLFKLLKARTHDVQSQELKTFAIELLKEHRLDGKTLSPSESSEIFMALFNKLKQKTSEEIKALILKEKEKTQSNVMESKDEEASKTSLTSYIYVDEWGYMHKCTQQLTKVDISFYPYQELF